MRLPIRNYLPVPMTVFHEPWCDEYTVPVGGEAIVALQDGWPHSIDMHPDSFITVWDEGTEKGTVEVFATYQSIHVPVRLPEKR